MRDSFDNRLPGVLTYLVVFDFFQRRRVCGLESFNSPTATTSSARSGAERQAMSRERLADGAVSPSGLSNEDSQLNSTGIM